MLSSRGHTWLCFPFYISKDSKVDQLFLAYAHLVLSHYLFLIISASFSDFWTCVIRAGPPGESRNLHFSALHLNLLFLGRWYIKRYWETEILWPHQHRHKRTVKAQDHLVWVLVWINIWPFLALFCISMTNLSFCISNPKGAERECL